MAKRSLLQELTELRTAAVKLFQAGVEATPAQWEALRKALGLPNGTKPGESHA